MLALPVLVVRQRGVDGGIFDMALGEYRIYQLLMDEHCNATAHMNAFTAWCADVRQGKSERMGGT